MSSRILIKSFSHYPWCDQSGCNQAWPEGGRSSRLTSVIFPFCQFAGTIIVTSSRWSHMSLDLQLSSRIFLLLPDVSALTCASCHVTLLSVPNQMTCTRSYFSWPTSWRQHSRHEILVSWLTPLPQAILSIYRLTCIQYLISSPIVHCPWHLTIDCQPKTHFVFSAHLALSLILDDLNLWVQTHTHSPPAKLHWPKSMYIKLVTTCDWHIAIRQLSQLQASCNFPNIATIHFVQRVQEIAVGKATETWAPVCGAVLQMTTLITKKK